MPKIQVTRISDGVQAMLEHEARGVGPAIDTQGAEFRAYTSWLHITGPDDLEWYVQTDAEEGEATGDAIAFHTEHEIRTIKDQGYVIASSAVWVD